MEHPLAPLSRQLTPMMRQYAQAKAAHPDAIVLFRLGDFYEMFAEDAERCSRLLELVLTQHVPELVLYQRFVVVARTQLLWHPKSPTRLSSFWTPTLP